MIFFCIARITLVMLLVISRDLNYLTNMIVGIFASLSLRLMKSFLSANSTSSPLRILCYFFPMTAKNTIFVLNPLPLLSYSSLFVLIYVCLRGNTISRSEANQLILVLFFLEYDLVFVTVRQCSSSADAEHHNYQKHCKYSLRHSDNPPSLIYWIIVLLHYYSHNFVAPFPERRTQLTSTSLRPPPQIKMYVRPQPLCWRPDAP